MTTDPSHTVDHAVAVLFENRSLDDGLGRLYGPEDGKTFEGVIGKDLSNHSGVSRARVGIAPTRSPEPSRMARRQRPLSVIVTPMASSKLDRQIPHGPNGV
jgi:hypothetical protein